jgi:transcriptional repressor NrdR
MRCPFCGHGDNKVIDSRLGREGEEIRRRRECLECQRRFTTRERVEEVLPKVVKRDDQRREEWDRRKLTASLAKACAKRPVSAEALARLGDRIERRLQELGAPEVSSRTLGEWVLEELTALDAVAAARFASVFHGFDGAEDYAKFFASLAKPLARKA